MLEVPALEPGERIEAPLAVRAKRGVAPYSGGHVVRLQVGNATGELPAKLWLGPDADTAQQIHDRLDVGTVARFEGRVAQYQGEIELACERSPAPVDPDAVDPAAFLPTTERHRGELLCRIRKTARSLRSPLRELVVEVWGRDAELDRLTQAPATKRRRRAWIGGLLEETDAQLELVQALSAAHPRLDRDLLLAAVLLRATGRAGTYRWDAAIEHTQPGLLLSPALLADARCREATQTVATLDEEELLRLRHAILAQPSRGRDRPLVPARTPEAHAAASLARLDASLARFLDVTAELGDEDVAWVPELSRLVVPASPQGALEGT